METLLRDLSHGWRVLRRRPAFTALVVLTLALGIGANSAVFGVLDAVILRPLPYAGADRLVAPWASAPQFGFDQIPLSYPNYMDWKSQSTSFDGFGVFSTQTMNLTGGGEPEQLPAAAVSYDLFGVLGVAPARGRGFTEAEGRPGGGRAVILSHGLWQRRFGGDAGIVGQPIRLNDESYTVVGVMPQRFQFPPSFSVAGAKISATAIWVPLAMEVDPAARGNFFLFPVARLKDGVSVAQAQAELETLSQRLAQAYPETNTGIGARVVALHEQVVGGVRLMLIVLLGAVGFVLLIACANVANLMLAQVLSREREFLIRSALGASRRGVIRQLLAESLPLSLLGGVFGLILAGLGLKLLIAVSPGDIPRLDEAVIDGRVLGFTLLVAMLVTFTFGLVPLLQVRTKDLSEAMKEGGRSSTGVAGSLLRKSLGVAEIALALVLLVGAGLLLKSLVQISRVDPGFKADRVLALSVTPPESKYEAAQLQGFYDRLLERMRALSGVEEVGATSLLPLGGGDASTGFFIDGKPDDPAQPRQLHYRTITPGYLRSLGIAVRGRDFDSRDQAGSARVILINETLARRFWPGEDPVGKRLAIDYEVDGADGERAAAWREVVGVVADVRHSGLDSDAKPEAFLPFSQSPARTMSVVARTRSDPRSLLGEVRSAVAGVDPDLPISDISAMEDLVSQSMSQRRFNMILLGVFASLALILGGVGVYGVMSHLVAQRHHEIGIRMTLGAQRSDVVKAVFRQGMVLAAIGIVLGVGASLALGRVLTSLLYQVSSTDLPTLLGSLVVVAAMVGLGCFLPARRAAALEPLEVIRTD